MSTDTTAPELEVLTEQELDDIVGGSVRSFNAQDFVYNKIGMCGCGLAH